MPKVNFHRPGEHGEDRNVDEADARHEDMLQGFRLLDLPGEIRIEILRYFLSQNVVHFDQNPQVIGRQFGWPAGYSPHSKFCVKWCSLQECSNYNTGLTLGHHHPTLPPGFALGLLLVCRQIYYEAIAMLYSENIFDFSDILTFGDFVAQGIAPIQKIRKLQVRYWLPVLPGDAMLHPQRGVRVAVRLSYEGAAMFMHFVSKMMPQLRDTKLSFDGHRRPSAYMTDHSQRRTEWARFITQLAEHAGRPDFENRIEEQPKKKGVKANSSPAIYSREHRQSSEIEIRYHW